MFEMCVLLFCGSKGFDGRCGFVLLLALLAISFVFRVYFFPPCLVIPVLVLSSFNYFLLLTYTIVIHLYPLFDPYTLPSSLCTVFYSNCFWVCLVFVRFARLILHSHDKKVSQRMVYLVYTLVLRQGRGRG